MVSKKKDLAKLEQLRLLSGLLRIFSTGHDVRTIILPVFDLLKDLFGVCLAAVFIHDHFATELVLASDYEIGRETTEEILNLLDRDFTSKNAGKIERGLVTAFAQKSGRNVPGKPDMGTNIIMPLNSGAGEEGVLFLAGAAVGSLCPEDILVLDIFADGLALFVKNEKTKKAAADTKSELESMLHNMSEGVIALNNKCEVTLINQAAKLPLGFKKIKMGDQLWRSLGEKGIVDLQKELSSGKEAITKEINFFANGKETDLRFYIAPTMDSVGRQKGWIMLLTDITKEKEIDRMKSEFISTTSHELRTPLAAIKESIMLILDGVVGETTEEQIRFLTIAKRNIERLMALINDMLDISKIETGKIEIKKKPCDVAEVIDGVMSSMQFLAKENNLKLKSDVPAGLPPVNFDPDRITQVLVNLIGNAIKFTPAGGSVTVGSRKSGVRSQDSKPRTSNFIEISVIDTGVGIDAKDMSKLFTRFGQLDSSLTRKPGGTGLGLAICKDLIRMHGGEIWVESEAGKGSKFVFTLPI